MGNGSYRARYSTFRARGPMSLTRGSWPPRPDVRPRGWPVGRPLSISSAVRLDVLVDHIGKIGAAGYPRQGQSACTTKVLAAILVPPIEVSCRESGCRDGLRTSEVGTVGPALTFASRLSSILANVRIKGRQAILGCQWGSWIGHSLWELAAGWGRRLSNPVHSSGSKHAEPI
jgi:hypothetical protein